MTTSHRSIDPGTRISSVSVPRMQPFRRTGKKPVNTGVLTVDMESLEKQPPISYLFERSIQSG